NYSVKSAVARAGTLRKLPVKIANHQGWASVQFASPATREVKWEVEFQPADTSRSPPSDPAGLFVQRAGLDGVNLNWREQYYLNAGYQVYLDGRLLGYTPSAKFPIRGLNPQTEYSAEVKTIAEHGHESPRRAELKFTLAKMVPAEMSLT